MNSFVGLNSMFPSLSLKFGFLIFAKILLDFLNFYLHY